MSDELAVSQPHDYPTIRNNSYISGFQDCLDLIGKEMRLCGFTENDIRVSIFQARIRLHRVIDF